jgi:hypothetical protein
MGTRLSFPSRCCAQEIEDGAPTSSTPLMQPSATLLPHPASLYLSSPRIPSPPKLFPRRPDASPLSPSVQTEPFHVSPHSSAFLESPSPRGVRFSMNSTSEVSGGKEQDSHTCTPPSSTYVAPPPLPKPGASPVPTPSPLPPHLAPGSSPGLMRSSAAAHVTIDGNLLDILSVRPMDLALSPTFHISSLAHTPPREESMRDDGDLDAATESDGAD